MHLAAAAMRPFQAMLSWLRYGVCIVEKLMTGTTVSSSRCDDSNFEPALAGSLRSDQRWIAPAIVAETLIAGNYCEDNFFHFVDIAWKVNLHVRPLYAVIANALVAGAFCIGSWSNLGILPKTLHTGY